MATRGRNPLGKALAFPPRVGPDGRWAWSEGVENVRENIRIILMTEVGERIMRPRFGAGLDQFLHEPNVAATHRLIEERCSRALARWEPRIRVQSLEVAQDPEDEKAATVTVRYELVALRTTERIAVSVPVGA